MADFFKRCAVRLLHGRSSGFVVLALLLLLWEVSARIGSPSDTWPPLSHVMRAMWSGVRSGELGAAGASSLGRMMSGYLCGALAGVVVGMAMASSRVLRALIGPSMELLRPIPVPAIVPPLVLLLGIDDAMKVSVVAFASFFPVLINTLQGALGIDSALVDTTRTFRTGRWRLVVRVVFPATLPHIFAGLRISLSLAMIVTIVAEMIAGSAGLGYYLVSMQYAMRPADMYAGVILIAIAGYTLNAAFVAAERKLLSWHQTTT